MSSLRESRVLLGSSPVAGPCLGSSPPTGSSKDKGAKNLFNRLRHDPSLDPLQFVVGYVESEQQAERRSGAEAWSMRIHDHLVEMPFQEFTAKFTETERVPFHRIAYFSQNGLRVWESEYHRKRLFPEVSPVLGPSPGVYGTPPSGLHPRRSSRDPSMQERDMPGGGLANGGVPSASTASMRSTFARRSAGVGWAQGSASCGGTLAGGSDDEGVCGGGGSVGLDDEDDEEEDGLMGQTLDYDDDGSDSSRGEEELEEGPRELSLPEECWMNVLSNLHVRDLCMMSRVNRWLRQLCGTASVWQHCHSKVFGDDPPSEWNTATVKRMCRRSQLKAARWIEAQPVARHIGSSNTRCLAMDDTKVVSGDGSALRVWSHVTGRKIATLQGHAGRVTCVTFDDNLVVSGCSQAVVKVWGMDDLKCMRTLRGHETAITGVVLLPGGMLASCSEDGTIQVWDSSSSQAIIPLITHQPVMAMHAAQQAGHLIVAGTDIQIWDPSSAQLLHTLKAMPTGSPGRHAGQTDAHQFWADHAFDGEGAFDGLDEELGAADAIDATNNGAGQAASQHGGGPFTSVSMSGNLLAAGRSDDILLWDVRTQQQVASISSTAWASMMDQQPPPTTPYPPHAARPPLTPAAMQQYHQGAIARAALGRDGAAASAGGTLPLVRGASWEGRQGQAVLSGSPLPGMHPWALGAHSLPTHAIAAAVGGSDYVPGSSWTGRPATDTIGPSCFESPLVAAAAAGGNNAIADSSGAAQGLRGVPWMFTGVQLDDWKLVVGCGRGPGVGSVVVMDIRAASSNSSVGGSGTSVGGWTSWQQPLMVLHAPARVNCFQYHSQMLLAGLEGRECCMWTMEPPGTPGPASYAAPFGMETSGAAAGSSRYTPQRDRLGGGRNGGGRGRDGAGASGAAAGWDGIGDAAVFGRSPPGLWGASPAGGEGDGDERGTGGRGGKKKPTKAPKKQTRYPKRNGK